VTEVHHDIDGRRSEEEEEEEGARSHCKGLMRVSDHDFGLYFGSKWVVCADGEH